MNSNHDVVFRRQFVGGAFASSSLFGTLAIRAEDNGRVALLALAPLGEDISGAWWRSDAGEIITEATCRWLLGR